MRLRSVVLGLAAMTSAFIAVSAVRAEDGIYTPLMSYRTGPYSGAGAAIFNGMSDYLAMLNARDGGIGGARLLVEECETGYDTKKGGSSVTIRRKAKIPSSARPIRPASRCS